MHFANRFSGICFIRCAADNVIREGKLTCCIFLWDLSTRTVSSIRKKPLIFEKKTEWFEREDVRRVIRNIDKTEVIDGECLRSPVFGTISPERLSTVCKATILMIMYDKYKVYATKCGDNCAPDILEIARTKDLTIVLHHIMRFPEPFEAIVTDSGVKVQTLGEFVDEFYKFRG